MRLISTGIAALIALSCTSLSWAQTDGGLETLPPKVLSAKEAAKRDLRGLRIARPGALAFASYDADGSLMITEEEISAGAARSFAVADVNDDGSMSIFEQQDWAAAIGAHDGALANSTTFDSNFDRRISETEFVDGMIRLSRAYIDADSGILHLSDLLEAPAGGAAKPSRELFEVNTNQRPAQDEHSGISPRSRTNPSHY